MIPGKVSITVTIAAVLIVIQPSLNFGIQPYARPCFQDLCRCSITIANCSNNQKRLTFIPKLMSWVENINLFCFTDNYLPNIMKNTVENITHYKITFLRLKSNRVQHVAPSAFKKLVHLLTLDLSDNPLIDKKDLKLTFQNMPETFGYLYLNRLKITDQHLQNSLLEGLKKNSMTGIHLAGNQLTTFDFSSHFSNFSSLVTLSVESNNISTIINISKSSSSLIHLWFENNYLTEMPLLCLDGGSQKAAFPNLQTLSVEYNEISLLAVSNMPCLKKLDKLFLSANPIQIIERDTFKDLNLTELFILRNKKPLTVERGAFGSGKLKILNLADSNMKYLSDDAFQDKESECTLNRIDLSFTNFTGWDRKLYVLLEPCFRSLKKFRCSGCNLTEVPTAIHSMPQLEELIMNENKVTTIKKNTFSSKYKLRQLDLSKNKISHIPAGVISESLQRGLKHASLEGNPFICDCTLLWLKKWLLNDKALFKDRLQYYTCSEQVNPKKVMLVDVGYISESACHSDGSMFFHVFGVVIIVLLCLMFFALGYKWRWNIRYCLKWGRYEKSSPEETQSLLTTGAYVLFCDEDFTFVRHQVLPNLETRGHLKLCFRNRDFNPKDHMVDSIVNNLRQSKTILFVVSNSFFKDTSSLFELSLVKKHLERKRGVNLVVLKLEDIDARYMSHELNRLMLGRESIRWKDTNGLAVWQFLLSQLTD